MSSTLTPALVAAHAPALARTKQSWKINPNEITALKEKEPVKNRLFSIFLALYASLAKYLFIFASFFEAKHLTNLIINLNTLKMKKLVLALVCLVSVAFFASCNPEGQPSIAILQEEGYVQDGDVVDINTDFNFGFVMASSPMTNKELSSLTIKIGDEESETIALTGYEYTYKGTLKYELTAKEEIIGEATIYATVTDVAGETASISIKLSINQPAQQLVPTAFTWNRHGGNDGTGLDEFGLKWEKNVAKAIYAVIEPVEGATLYKFDPSVWDATTTDVEKAALFSEATPADPQQWKEFNVAGAMTQEFDVVLGTTYNGENHLIHITKGTYYTFKGTDATIEGEAK